MEESKLKEAGLGDLIGRIKAEGIDEAERKSKEIIDKAKSDAEKIIAAAREEAKAMILHGETELAEKSEKWRASIDLAARDAVIQVKRSIEDMMASIVKRECRLAMSGDGLGNVISKVVEAWSRDGSAPLEVLISESEREALSDSFIKKLADQLKEGLEIKGLSGIRGGFRIGNAGDDMHYDFSDEAVAELLLSHLAPEIALTIDQHKGKKSDQ